MNKLIYKVKKALKIAGPGIVTGAADDDPSGIATYTQTGAQFGYSQLWAVVAILPFLVATQEAAARIGSVTGKGLAAIIKRHYNKRVLFFAVALVCIANTINIGANIGAMAEAANLIFPINFNILILFFALLILALEIFIPYKTYSKILKWLALALLFYPITLFLINEPWLEIIRYTFIPSIKMDFNFFFIITGVLGTTVSPYMFFWEASQEVEELKAKRLLRKNIFPRGLDKFLYNMRIDNFIGMLMSNIAAWSIIVVAASVLHSNGITDIGTAADAARALEPLVQTFPNAGLMAKIIFAIGIIGLGLLAVPVLSGSASYALSEAFGWEHGLGRKFKRVKQFYSVIIIATLVGLLINFIGLDPIKALVFAAVFNGVISAPLLFLIARIARSREIMGEYRSGRLSNVLVWATFAVMSLSVIIMFITLGQKIF